MDRVVNVGLPHSFAQTSGGSGVGGGPTGCSAGPSDGSLCSYPSQTDAIMMGWAEGDSLVSACPPGEWNGGVGDGASYISRPCLSLGTGRGHLRQGRSVGLPSGGEGGIVSGEPSPPAAPSHPATCY